MKYLTLIILLTWCSIQSQIKYERHIDQKVFYSNSDTVKPKTTGKRTISGIFLGIGGGISIPSSTFNENSDVSFGLLGRLEFASTAIFPFVIGGEITYFVYNGSDQFKTVNVLNTFKTKVLSYGLNIEYSLSKLLPSAFTMPFLTADVKSNNIKRDIDAGKNLDSLNLPSTESKISVGAGFGFTMFIFDFHVKYNYMKNNNNIGVYVKTKIPVIRF